MFLLISILAALVIFVVSANSSWENVLSPKRNHLVFEGRVKEYGAYQLRREQPRNMFIALFLSTGIVSTFFLLLQSGNNASPFVARPVSDEIWTLITLPEIEKEEDTAEILPDEPKPTTSSAAAGFENEGTSTEVEITTDASTHTNTEQPGSEEGSEDGLALGNTGSGNDLTGSETGGGEGDGTDHSSVVIPDWAEVMPVFPGGETAMSRFIADRVRYSPRDRQMNINGTLYISFVVNTDGSISDVQVLNELRNGQDLAHRALKAIQGMPRWSPGKNGENPVRVRFVMPIKLKLENN